MKNMIILFSFFFTLYSCATDNNIIITKDSKHTEKGMSIDNSLYKTAYFASGCFWCVEAVFESVKGVIEAESGYSGGIIKNPTYEQICSGKLQHAESVKVIYNPEIVDYSTLLNVFFNSHDPTTLNRQGPDSGPQYRSIVFYQDDSEKEMARDRIKILLDNHVFSKITTELKEFDVFYRAEEYHQDYERNHPNNSYVKAVSLPRLNAFKAKMPEVLK